MTSRSAASRNLRARLRGQRALRITYPKFFPSRVHEFPFVEALEAQEGPGIDRVARDPAFSGAMLGGGANGIEPLSCGHPGATGTVLVQDVENKKECIKNSCIFVAKFLQPRGATVAPK